MILFINHGKVIRNEGYEPPVNDFSISIDGADYTDSILNSDYAIFNVAYDLSKTTKGHGVKLMIYLLELKK